MHGSHLLKGGALGRLGIDRELTRVGIGNKPLGHHEEQHNGEHQQAHRNHLHQLGLAQGRRQAEAIGAAEPLKQAIEPLQQAVSGQGSSWLGQQPGRQHRREAEGDNPREQDRQAEGDGKFPEQAA